MEINVKIHWDDEAEVWVAICDELGISLESGSYDALIEKIRVVIPEMITENNLSGIKTINISTTNRPIVCA